ncbi:MAG: LacI family DNA-binding transcriptional regulator [Spirochaetales bacterium]|uniref:LacI family DNA-binding transcriptional regulator n=1 Tax=Candidatus Thalassospirochaeta sargassi TaxID=3119039 RepID=A0AAJ1MNV0_9SPIO|nr:LacI family DNA-binding transcriptional regulator [Spirochaetales bacterium]
MCIIQYREEPLTIKELAKIAGLNHSTVSRSLNNSPLISDETKKRVLKLAEEYDFELNASARGMRTNKTGTIGVIFPVIRDRYRDMQYLGSLMNTLRYTIEEEQYDSIITMPVNPVTGKSNIRKLIQQHKVDGLLLVLQDLEADDREILEESKMPFVSLHFKWQSGYKADDNYVYPDNYKGGYLAAECLLDTGCRKLITLTEPGGLYEFEERTRGYLKAQRDRGIDAAENCIFFGETGFDFGYSFIMENLSLLRDVDGIFAQADMNAIGVIEALKESGLRVPGDIAVVGYDDIDIDYFFKPRLTTIHQPREEYTEIACRKLIELIENKEETQLVQRVIEPNLLIRESCVNKDEIK